jgi:hypothetical protein
VVDREVRRTWQIDSAKVRIGGRHWEKTLAGLVAEIAPQRRIAISTSLSCRLRRVEAPNIPVITAAAAGVEFNITSVETCSSRNGLY